MPHVSVTRLRLRSARHLPAFLWSTTRSSQQARRADGFMGGSVLRDGLLTYWTLTVWDERASMRRYVLAGSHRAAMPRVLDWCDEASVLGWEAERAEVPSWTEAAQRMQAEGRPSKVRKPSPSHATLGFPMPSGASAVALRPATRPQGSPTP